MKYPDLKKKAWFNSLKLVCITLQPTTKKHSYRTKQAEVKKLHHLRAIYFIWGFNFLH